VFFHFKIRIIYNNEYKVNLQKIFFSLLIFQFYKKFLLNHNNLFDLKYFDFPKFKKNFKIFH
jgi:hypothetical protein